MNQDIQGRNEVLRLHGEMTIYRAGELAQQVLSALRQQPLPHIDLSEVTEFDTAGMQILLLAHRFAAASEMRLAIVNPSECVREVLTLCNLTHLIDAQAELAS
ncbi:MAG TPA: STAS domain-containing protein [Povalibacter sp.]|nr:STAS domain-containing protein [Povalibacter sp.]